VTRRIAEGTRRRIRRASLWLGRRATPPAAPGDGEAPTRGTTRRGFIQIGAASSVAVVGLSRVLPARAEPEPFFLTITEGDVAMEDGTPVFFRGFRATDAIKDVPSIPGPPIGNTGPGIKGRDVFAGDDVLIMVTNSTPRDHTFLIARVDADDLSPDPAPAEIVKTTTIPANQTCPIKFTAPQAGTYMYRDADRNNRLLGMYGAFIVLPRNAAGQLRPYDPAPDRLEILTELRSQHTWVLSDVDPVLGELARVQRRNGKIDYPLTKITPRYFLINGETGVEATRNEQLTIPVIPLHHEGEPFAGVLIRCINTGVATHALHWHGNHVFPVQRNAVPEGASPKDGKIRAFEKDVVRIKALQTVDVILPAHTGFEAFPPLNDLHPKVAEQHFPMHCHAEMSQTAAGGSYPFGMLTDWHLVNNQQTAIAVRQRLADERRDGQRRVPDDQVQAAIDQRVGNSGHGSGSGSGDGQGQSGSGDGASGGSNGGSGDSSSGSGGKG